LTELLAVAALAIATAAFGLSAWNVYTRSHADKQNVGKLIDIISRIDGEYMTFLDELREATGLKKR